MRKNRRIWHCTPRFPLSHHRRRDAAISEISWNGEHNAECQKPIPLYDGCCIILV
jgi:hypothetical protein